MSSFFLFIYLLVPTDPNSLQFIVLKEFLCTESLQGFAIYNREFFLGGVSLILVSRNHNDMTFIFC